MVRFFAKAVEEGLQLCKLPKKLKENLTDSYLTKRERGDIIIKLSHERAKRLREQAREGKT